MQLRKLQKYAQNHGFNTLKFKIISPNGNELNCQWLDAYFGFFTIEGQEGFLTVEQYEKIRKNADNCEIVTN